jgi:predicted ester cyclase
VPRSVFVATAALLLTLGLFAGVSRRGVAQDATPAADCPVTTPEQNKALVQRFIDEVYLARNPAAVDEFLADDFNRTNPARPHSNEPGNEDDAARVARSLEEFPDLTSTVDQMIAEGDKVMVLMTISGTNDGDFPDLGVTATDRHAEWQSVIIWRVACGLLAENWVVTDRLSEYRQLGIISDAELATAEEPVASPAP